MKAWFVFFINGKKIATWANNTDEARENMIAEFGDVPMKYLGIYFNKFGERPDGIIRHGMSPVDTMIAFGLVNMLIGLRYGR